ncbi:hypothetical protein MSAN_00946900 [Mycena sanguinolenta]|uniref:Uncharacterized protein n=1 Tax=Mycena sanguinolenta TaxID=230812 RepID=A0A8H7DBM9_9AGAR|nr:hypothetical protein MSAN_00946900 [Mycena sanguinolenta]
MSPLPQELVDIVVDNLRDDIPSLKSCAFAARTFLTSARCHIFRRIEIAPPKPKTTPSSSPCQNLLALLTSSPHLPPLVEELCIVSMGSSSNEILEPDKTSSIIKGPRSWIMTDDSLSLILPLLNLKRISLIENASPWGAAVRWNDVPYPLYTALTATFCSPSLKAIHLRGIIIDSPAQLLALFRDAASLTELSLSRVRFTETLPAHTASLWPDLDARPWRPRLRTLLLSDQPKTGPLCEYLSSPGIDLADVKVLTVATYQPESRNIITQAASTVEHLRLLYTPSGAYTSIFNNSTLRSIHIFAIWRWLFRAIHSFFRSFTDESHLEVVVFEGLHPQSGSDGDDVGLRGLSELDAAIDAAIERHFHSLETVEIQRTLYLNCDRLRSFEDWSVTMREALPSLAARGILRLKENRVPNNGVHHGFE